MTYRLFIGDRSYSSWSMRAGLLIDRIATEAELVEVDFAKDGVADQLAAVAPARTVPTLQTPEGAIVWDSAAIAEELATRHPDAGLLPRDPADRALARSLVAEMHAGFAALRTECPMNLRLAYRGFDASPAVRADLDRIETIWSHARTRCGGTGPWLCGAYSVADAFFAPVAARIATYDLPVQPEASEYVRAHLADGGFRRWRAVGLVRGSDLPWYTMDLPRRDWPGPRPMSARAAEAGPSVNAACPLSGLPVRAYAEIGGRVWGFASAWQRDAVVADAAAWPAFMAVYDA